MHAAAPLRMARRSACAQAISQLSSHSRRGLETSPRSPWLHTPFRSAYRRFPARQIRFHSTGEQPTQMPLTDRGGKINESAQHDADTIAARKALSPAYQLWVTCKKCLERSSHTISKQAYHFGSCVIQCPKCKAKHLVSDNLKIFSDTNTTMEDIAKEHGEKLRKGRLGVDGDIEFYDDEATTVVINEARRAAAAQEVFKGPSNT